MKRSPRNADLVQSPYFGGLSLRATAGVAGLSSGTIDRDLRMARVDQKPAFLHRKGIAEHGSAGRAWANLYLRHKCVRALSLMRDAPRVI